MDRSLYPSNVEVRQQALENTETTKAFHIKRRWLDAGVQGVATGLGVTVNASNTSLIDVAAGTGYVPTNEYAELTASTTGLALSNYTLGTDNYVCVVYGELPSRPEAPATGGTARDTQAGRTVRVRVYTLTELSALPATSADYTLDAQDRVLVCGIVTAQGAGVALTVANIASPVAAQTELLSIVQPSTITGVIVTSISAATLQSRETPLTNPLARITYASGVTPPSTATLAYRSPGDSAVGATVSVAASGSYTLISNNAVDSIVVSVVAEMLPLNVSTTINEDLSITDVYYSAAPRYSARDQQHRQGLGTGVPNARNVHGLRVTDLDDRIIEAREGVLLGTGLVSNDNQALTPRITTRLVATFGGGRTMLWDMPITGSVRHVRMYVSSSRAVEFTVNARWNGTGWAKDDGAALASRFVVTDTGFTNYLRTAGSAAVWNDGAWTANPFYSTYGGTDEQGQVLINTQAVLGANLLGSLAARSTARTVVNYASSGGGGDLRTLLWQSALNTVPGSSTIRIYRCVAPLTSAATDVIEVVTNATWNNGTNQWQKDVGALQASKLEFGKTVIYCLQRLAASGANFTDAVGAGGWDAPSANLALTTGVWTAGNYAYTTARSFRRSFSASAFVVPSVCITTAAFPTGGGVGGTQINRYNSDPTTGAPAYLTWAATFTNGCHMPLILPDGATLTQIVLNGIWTPGANTIRASVARIQRGSAVTTALLAAGYVNFADSAGVAADRTITPDQNNVIDNSQYAYDLTLYQSGGFAPVIQLQQGYLDFTVPSVILA